jgi:hypothetical protein
MKIEFKRPTLYVSHPIRGESNNVTKNCNKATAAVRRLRRVFPEIDFYCPGENNLVLQILLNVYSWSVDEVLFADLMILGACHGWMKYSFEGSEGAQIEQERACWLNISDGSEIFTYDIEKLSYQKTRKDFGPLIEKTVKRFKGKR